MSGHVAPEDALAHSVCWCLAVAVARVGTQALGADRPPWHLPGAPSGSEHSTGTFGYVVGAGAA